ncbi:MAG: exodeoxyribonuclease VII large subunit [FCB group bacterium]|nr:exodeoxyribonuclease VII large subunit [FCB group bacterium]
MIDTPEQVYTVTAVNRMARYTLEESFSSVWVEGEISNYHHHQSSGHRYFSIKDDQSQLSCAMWRSQAANLKFEPKDGLKVLVNGSLTIYERGGRYQLSAKRMLPSGKGELELAFRQLKEKLEKEGLFDPSVKKELPAYPMKIGVVTSPTGAVIHDIIRVVKRRNPRMGIILWPSEVQGDIAPTQLVEGINRLNEQGEADLIIIGRGGGSLEDLWAFNDERVVRAVFGSATPVISAVGHEVDITLSDLAADYSAATPSMAAEIAAWPLGDMFVTIKDYLSDMHRAVTDSWDYRKSRLDDLLRSPAMARPEAMLENRYQYLDQSIRLLHLLSEKRFNTFREAAALGASRLEALSPLAVLARGYSVTRREKDKVLLRSVKDIDPESRIETGLKDGWIVSTVNTVRKKK